MEDKQKLWDELLIEGWHKFWKVQGVYLQFYRRDKQMPDEEIINLPFEETRNYALQFNLKRSYVRYNGEKAAIYGRQEVRGMIAAQSPKLSNCLWSGKHKDEEILEAIDRFPWSYKNSAAVKLDREQQRERRKNKTEMGRTRTIRVRTHSSAGNTDWSKVK